MGNAGALMSVGTIAAVLAAAAATAALSYFFFRASNSRQSARDVASRGRRLGVVERTALDDGRDLILIRRDDVEHLLVVGGPVDIVVETGIQASLSNAAQSAPMSGYAGDAPLVRGAFGWQTRDRSTGTLPQENTRPHEPSLGAPQPALDDDTPLELSLFDRTRPSRSD